MTPRCLIAMPANRRWSSSRRCVIVQADHAAAGSTNASLGMVVGGAAHLHHVHLGRRPVNGGSALPFSPQKVRKMFTNSQWLPTVGMASVQVNDLCQRWPTLATYACLVGDQEGRLSLVGL